MIWESDCARVLESNLRLYTNLGAVITILGRIGPAALWRHNGDFDLYCFTFEKEATTWPRYG